MQCNRRTFVKAFALSLVFGPSLIEAEVTNAQEPEKLTVEEDQLRRKIAAGIYFNNPEVKYDERGNLVVEYSTDITRNPFPEYIPLTKFVSSDGKTWYGFTPLTPEGDVASTIRFIAPACDNSQSQRVVFVDGRYSTLGIGRRPIDWFGEVPLTDMGIFGTGNIDVPVFDCIKLTETPPAYQL
jgi:hypothetical protein